MGKRLDKLIELEKALLSAAKDKAQDAIEVIVKACKQSKQLTESTIVRLSSSLKVDMYGRAVIDRVSKKISRASINLFPFSKFSAGACGVCVSEKEGKLYILLQLNKRKSDHWSLPEGFATAGPAKGAEDGNDYLDTHEKDEAEINICRGKSVEEAYAEYEAEASSLTLKPYHFDRSLEETMQRELFEEVGIESSFKPHLLYSDTEYRKGIKTHLIRNHYVVYFGQELPTPKPDGTETLHAYWADVDEIEFKKDHTGKLCYFFKNLPIGDTYLPVIDMGIRFIRDCHLKEVSKHIIQSIKHLYAFIDHCELNFPKSAAFSELDVSAKPHHAKCLHLSKTIGDELRNQSLSTKGSKMVTAPNTNMH